MDDATDILDLIARCNDGDDEARTGFQELYGELIYRYPIRVFRVPAEDAADFYVFAFEKGRIFRRVRSYAGRAPFRAFLLGYVLDGLVIDWQRAARPLRTSGLDDPDDLPAPPVNGHQPGGDPLGSWLREIDPTKAIVVKLLHAEDADFTADDVRILAERSGRSVLEVVETIEQLRSGVREREAQEKALEEKLDVNHSWIEAYERRLRATEGELERAQPGAEKAAELERDRTQLERRVERRRQNRDSLLARVRGHRSTVSYKDIAALLNTTVGNVGSQVTRLRRELQRRGAPR